MRELLESVADGEVSVAEAEAKLTGYATNGAGRFDAARETRRGVPEAVLCDGKTPSEVAELSATAVETAGRALVTRADEEHTEAVRRRLDADHPDATVTIHDRANLLVAHGPEFEVPNIDATVGVVSAGTSDAIPAGEAAVIAAEMGATIEELHDVGVASIARMLDEVDTLRAVDALVVAAGREGALPTVVAGLVNTPVIGLPVSNGYGHASGGEAALSGMLQSCTVLSTVNIDAGFVAGAQAGLIARAVGGAREE
ncbi:MULTISPECIES: nickel pincer cofactor biosynthesis protein LarB [unclassified Haladaptatus]|uniref:nickel pincer cofactor biosynthesis protein LarB n=1 Tax=unclassified Haladaptatus TaxID=2622732 RepID=UPI00209C487C|nr:MULTISPECIES: nickel pincer cofactor biosynthesis protein LarB [unclassified Haladaptatus]MCO8242682.1 nickel pincer cofactor biosynthesis protein LarB [Haladaptatus sp. AB643]MCO8252441.1 nickel pincer cofactor biosynthesis protein LarB [Haladaptatus sp. AB618]